MVRKRQSREPLFYIQQPNIRKPEAPMQDNYSTPKRTQKESPKQEEENSSFHTLQRGNNFQRFQNPQPVTKDEPAKDDIQEQVHDEEVAQNEVDTTDTDEESPRSRFKDMTISEKIDYFVHKPSHMPKLKCEVATEDRAYRGVIIAREEEEEKEVIIVRSGRRNFTLPTKTVTEIRLLGL